MGPESESETEAGKARDSLRYRTEREMEKGQRETETETEEKTETGRANYGSRKIYKNRLDPRNVVVRMRAGQTLLTCQQQRPAQS